jgi:hypothetical protein
MTDAPKIVVVEDNEAIRKFLRVLCHITGTNYHAHAVREPR